MGLFSALFGSPIGDVEKALASFKPESGVSEAKFRDALLNHVSETIGPGSKRDGGLLGEGTRIDLCFDHGGEDFFITIKQGSSEQKAKILLGECLIVASSLITNKHPRTAHVIVMLMDDPKGKAEAWSLDGAAPRLRVFHFAHGGVRAEPPRQVSSQLGEKGRGGNARAEWLNRRTGKTRFASGYPAVPS